MATRPGHGCMAEGRNLDRQREKSQRRHLFRRIDNYHAPRRRRQHDLFTQHCAAAALYHIHLAINFIRPIDGDIEGRIGGEFGQGNGEPAGQGRRAVGCGNARDRQALRYPLAQSPQEISDRRAGAEACAHAVFD